MARNRMIKTDFWDDEKLATISRDSRLTFIALWNLSDDYGVVKGNSVWLKSNVFPYDEKLKLTEFETWLNELKDIKVIYSFNSNGEKYYYIKNFLEHQKINRPSTKRNPEPPENILEDSLHPHGAPITSLPSKGKEKEKEKEKSKLFASDSIEYRLANYLLKFILKRNPDHKKPDLQKWSEIIEKMLRIDKRNPDNVKNVIEWCQNDTTDKHSKGGWKGWANNILSTGKLRDHFDELFLKMQEDAAKPKYHPVTEHNLKVVEKFLENEGVA